MDFGHDQLAAGGKIRILTLLGTNSRYAHAIDAGVHDRADDVVATLEAVRNTVDYPKVIGGRPGLRVRVAGPRSVGLCPQRGPRLLPTSKSDGQCRHRGVRVVLAGGGPAEADYKAVARDLGVIDRVHFLGNIAHCEIGNLPNAADVFVIPSNWETFGLAAVEAAMYGVPVVANDIPVFREVLRETSTRFVDASDPVRLGAAIEECLSDSVARQARAKAPSVHARFSEAQMMRAYLQIIVEAK